jgi:predicted nucleic acid-binding protein
MKSVFADTFYFLALLNERDAAHKRAVAASRTPGLKVTTTEFVLLELADALCQPHQRIEVLTLWNVVETDPAFRLVRATTELIQGAKELYRERADKEWSLTDCVSFVVMQDQKLTEALTADHHFEQAGFKALLA